MPTDTPADPRLRQKAQSRWQRQNGDHPLSQAIRGPRDLRLFMRRSTIGAFDFESHLTDIGASTPRWKAALARSKPNSCTTLAIQPGKLPGMTCSLTSKDITIVSGSIPPSGISLPNRQSAKPLDPVSTKSGKGHQRYPLGSLRIRRCSRATTRDASLQPPARTDLARPIGSHCPTPSRVRSTPSAS
jgi:hypothetical protein